METVGVATQGEFVLRMRQVYVDVSLSSQALHEASGEPYLGAVPGGGAAAGLGGRRSLRSVIREAGQGTAARVLVVIGAPGSGKTTLARNTALELCERRWWRQNQLPVLIYLRDHAAELLGDEQPSLAKVAVTAPALEGKITPDWLEHRLDRGGCLILLDGLDEVADPAERGRVVAWVARQIDRHPHNTYVVTSRPHGYQSNPLPRAEVLQVRRFTPDQVKRFLQQWSYATERRARLGTDHEVQAAAARNAADLISRLRSRPALYDLAANPLLLTMTANVHRYRGQLPGSRAELYAEMCDVLLHRRTEARGLRDATGLSGPHKQHIVQHLALAMMKAQARYLPATEAVEVIRAPLRQVPGAVDPHLFLDEARKSGLLVEREHGYYEFAHLTLQEYLASAQLSTPQSDTTLLTANVDSSWWRETILLWSAGNDATDIVTACLDNRTVQALALAFDCADQAQTIDPGVRTRLDSLLSVTVSDQSSASELQRLLAGILATRSLRDTVQLSDETALCTHPVPQSLYAMFVREEQSQGRQHPPGADASSIDTPHAPAIGMQAGDAERFVTWVNTITSDVTYRLPNPDELADPAAMAIPLDNQTIWAGKDNRTLLHQPPRAAWPYTPRPPRSSTAPIQPYTTIRNDYHRLSSYPRFLLAPAESRSRILDTSAVFIAALARTDEAREGHRLTQRNLTLSLVLDLALLFCLTDIRTSSSARTSPPPFGDSSLGRLTPSAPQDRTLNLARGLADALQNGHRYNNLAPGDFTAVDQALSMSPLLQPGPRSDRQSALLAAQEVVVIHARGLVNTMLAGGSDSVGAHILYATDTLAPSQGPYADIGTFAAALHEAVTLAAGLPGHSPLGAPQLDVSAQDADSAVATTDEQDVVLAIELAFDSCAHATAPRCALMSFQILQELCERAGTLRIQPQRMETVVQAALEHFLARRSDSMPARGDWPEDPATWLADTQRLLADKPATPRQVPLLLDQAAELLTAVRDRRAPTTDLTMGAIRAALVAALSLLETSTADHETEQWLLYRTWQTLALQDHSITALHPENQVLLLARTQQ
ncbi:NACHT domain-containing protein [Streptomyces longisporoflavus]|uniref:NACHT domain-containing protein n=1 Tax=Streptomyces longisporoflavus TaxID=28044 RepID=A0ABW7QN92_9ACTN